MLFHRLFSSAIGLGVFGLCAASTLAQSTVQPLLSSEAGASFAYVSPKGYGLVAPDEVNHALNALVFFDSSGKTTPLADLIGTAVSRDFQAIAINQSGTAVGYVDTTSLAPPTCTFGKASKAAGFVQLGQTLSSCSPIRTASINEKGDVAVLRSPESGGQDVSVYFSTGSVSSFFLPALYQFSEGTFSLADDGSLYMIADHVSGSPQTLLRWSAAKGLETLISAPKLAVSLASNGTVAKAITNSASGIQASSGIPTQVATDVPTALGNQYTVTNYFGWESQLSYQNGEAFDANCLLSRSLWGAHAALDLKSVDANDRLYGVIAEDTYERKGTAVIINTNGAKPSLYCAKIHATIGGLCKKYYGKDIFKGRIIPQPTEKVCDLNIRVTDLNDNPLAKIPLYLLGDYSRSETTLRKKSLASTRTNAQGRAQIKYKLSKDTYYYLNADLHRTEFRRIDPLDINTYKR